MELEFDDQKATLFDMIMDRDKFLAYVRIKISLGPQNRARIIFLVQA